VREIDRPYREHKGRHLRAAQEVPEEWLRRRAAAPGASRPPEFRRPRGHAQRAPGGHSGILEELFRPFSGVDAYAVGRRAS
jgi:hypothetical protein